MARLSAANMTLPFVQDEEKWVEYYVEQALKQKHESDGRREYVFARIKPNLTLPINQLAAQSNSEKKAEEERKNTPFIPIKTAPGEEKDHTTGVDDNKRTYNIGKKRRRRRSVSNSPNKNKKKKSTSQYSNNGDSGDILGD